MSFQEYSPHRLNTAGMPAGMASIDAGGTARFHRADLEAAGITDRVRLLFDPATMRLAFRKPRPDEGAVAARVFCPGKKPSDQRRRTIRVAGVLSEMRLEPRDAAGRYSVLRKDNLIILNLDGSDSNEAGASNAGADKED